MVLECVRVYMCVRAWGYAYVSVCAPFANRIALHHLEKLLGSSISIRAERRYFYSGGMGWVFGDHGPLDRQGL